MQPSALLRLMPFRTPHVNGTLASINMSYMLYIIRILVFIVSPYTIYSQCEGNLIKNGSFELDSVGEGVFGKYWVSGIRPDINSPDIENANDEFTIIGNPGSTWSDTIRSSCDGGNWQNIASTFSPTINYFQTESFGQEIILNASVPHILEFEFTAQGIGSNSVGKNHWDYAAIDVFIDYKLVHTTQVDSTFFTWEKSEFLFTPSKKNIFLHFQINPINYRDSILHRKYVAIDGICVKPVEMGMFCEP